MDINSECAGCPWEMGFVLRCKSEAGSDKASRGDLAGSRVCACVCVCFASGFF